MQCTRPNDLLAEPHTNIVCFLAIASNIQYVQRNRYFSTRGDFFDWIKFLGIIAVARQVHSVRWHINAAQQLVYLPFNLICVKTPLSSLRNFLGVSIAVRSWLMVEFASAPARLYRSRRNVRRASLLHSTSFHFYHHLITRVECKMWQSLLFLSHCKHKMLLKCK